MRASRPKTQTTAALPVSCKTQDPEPAQVMRQTFRMSFAADTPRCRLLKNWRIPQKGNPVRIQLQDCYDRPTVGLCRRPSQFAVLA